jgi:hypothetical protein
LAIDPIVALVLLRSIYKLMRLPFFYTVLII